MYSTKGANCESVRTKPLCIPLLSTQCSQFNTMYSVHIGHILNLLEHSNLRSLVRYCEVKRIGTVLYGGNCIGY